MHSRVIVVVGLGYVGLPLAIEFGKKYRTIGYDLSETKISKLKKSIDPTEQVEEASFHASKNLTFSCNPEVIYDADVVIVTVPTPVDDAHVPDLTCMIDASSTVGAHMKKGVTVVYESTVYPGVTEEVCIPVLEKKSGMKWLEDFHVGYSPERVNPGDKIRTLTKIVKVVSGDDVATSNNLAQLYGSIIEAGVHKVSSIKVAEASKVIENTQRDLNIALMNELAIVFDKLDIDTKEVLEAAGTKWNFMPFRPGLVGGHCIGVDPYYLTHKAEMLGYHPQVILAGRRINDGMAGYIANATIQNMIQLGGCNKGDTVVVLGLTFKENCPDLRNSKVADLVSNLRGSGLNVVVHDPIANDEEAKKEYQIDLKLWGNLPNNAKALIVAVSHDQYLKMPIKDILKVLSPGAVFVDVKSSFDKNEIEDLGYKVWRL